MTLVVRVVEVGAIAVGRMDPASSLKSREKQVGIMDN